MSTILELIPDQGPLKDLLDKKKLEPVGLAKVRRNGVPIGPVDPIKLRKALHKVRRSGEKTELPMREGKKRKVLTTFYHARKVLDEMLKK